MCLLGVSLTLFLIYGVKCPENPNFGGVNRRFQAKLEKKYWKFHVIDTPASISTKFCTTMETIKWSSWVVPIGTQQIQDGGRPPFKKTVKSPYLCNRLTDFDEIWYSDAYWTRTADAPLKFRIFENPTWRRRHVENHKNRDISATVRPIFTKSRTLMQKGLLTYQTLQNWISKIQDGGQLPFWKPRGNWQDFNWHNASRGPSAIAEFLVSINFSMHSVWGMVMA